MSLLPRCPHPLIPPPRWGRGEKALPLTLLLPLAAVLSGAVPVGRNVPRNTPTVPLPPVCGVSLADPQILPLLPADAEGSLRQPNHNVAQRAADIFSWQEFLALNWPARADLRGEPDRKKRIAAPGPRVWETWKETHEVYLPDGGDPPVWNAPPRPPAGMSARKRLPDFSFAPFLRATLQATQSDGTLPATLTDRRGHRVHYEIRMNRVLFEAIRSQGLYNGRKQAAQEAVSFPNGSMLIKAAWRELDPAEEKRFFTTDAWIYEEKQGRRPAYWRRKRVGLVGLHIMQKTPGAPQWIWSTFEQVDNVSGPHPSFTNPSCRDCPPDKQTPAGVPNQVTRVAPIPHTDPDCSRESAAVDNVAALNRALQRALARQHSALQYYELVDTQWPTPSDTNAPPPIASTQVLPAVLSNTTMETFTQETSSCLGCHAMARTSRTDRFVSSDFTFTLNNARPLVPNTQIIPPPLHPATEWDRQNWPGIRRGLDLAEHTYERLP